MVYDEEDRQISRLFQVWMVSFSWAAISCNLTGMQASVFIQTTVAAESLIKASSLVKIIEPVIFR